MQYNQPWKNWADYAWNIIFLGHLWRDLEAAAARHLYCTGSSKNSGHI